MKLIFIYGPPASGKQTVGGELARFINYRILDNHKTVEMVRQLFPFEDPELNRIRRRLQTKFRLEMFEEAAKAGVNFITTCAIAGPQHFDYYRQTIKNVEKYNGTVLFVQLSPSREAMLQRVNGKSRKGIKIEDQEHLLNLLQNEPEVFTTFPDVRHLILDNTDLTPVEAAQKIQEYHNL